ncbi:ABC transporter substrate-binding protein [Kaistia sp. 32K]|uniref:ABC transporter substrate-binding protein n=1 Tax=Kaistia sp. 32K TaxID=2795690 RepID=UPI001914FBFA|nr:ABC transporter substrate-binding protein [Kaistia sp. 32K]BCP52211.1 ABC transporter substrate-binding protein [Kaistia sp. 32K]
MLKKGRGRFGAICLAAAMAAATVIGSASAQELREITVVLPHPGAIGQYPMHVAIGEGYFANEGLKVTVRAVDGSGQVVQAIAAGQGDIGVPGPGPLLSARMQGVDIVSFYNHFTKSQFGIMVGQDAPFQQLTDLKGKVIGIGTADGAEVSFARSMLDAAGMKEGADYTFLTVGDSGPATVAFQRGEIDAYAAATADAAILSMRGMNVRDVTPVEFQGYFGNGFAAMRPFIDANPTVMEGFGRALAKGAAFGQKPENREKVLQYSAVGNPQEAEDRKLLEALFDNIKLRVLPTDLSTGWGYNHPEQWQAWEKSLVASGSLKGPVDGLDKAYTNQFVAAWNEGLPQ